LIFFSNFWGLLRISELSQFTSKAMLSISHNFSLIPGFVRRFVLVNLNLFTCHDLIVFPKIFLQSFLIDP
jgi:hypothetical protein